MATALAYKFLLSGNLKPEQDIRSLIEPGRLFRALAPDLRRNHILYQERASGTFKVLSSVDRLSRYYDTVLTSLKN